MPDAPGLRIPELVGKVCLVSGGGEGIGLGIARAFARQGSPVVIADITAAHVASATEAITAEGHQVLGVVADVTDGEDVRRIVAETETRFGRIDVLVNNVGNSFGLVGPFEESTPEDWDRLYHANLRHVLLMTRECLPLMKRTAGAGSSIINISTIEAHRGFPLGAAYAAFKSALTGLTRSLGVELAPDGIRVNEIAPETTASWSISISNWLPAEATHEVANWIPLGRFGVPEDAAGCALFLASDMAAWVTGTTIHLDGGCSAAGGWVRTPDGKWTHRPTISGSRWPPPRASRPVATGKADA